MARLQKVASVVSTEQDQEGRWVWRDEEGRPYYWSDKPTRYVFHPVDTVGEADHVMFLCPACFEKNGGSQGTHSVWVSFAGRQIPDEAGTHDSKGNPVRWSASGTTIDDLVLSPSILLDAERPPDKGCHWHGFVGMNGNLPGYAG